MTYLPVAVLLLAWWPASRLARWTWLERSPRVAIVGLLWVVFTQYESLLGPLARPEWGDGDRLFLGYFGYLADHHAQRFLPELMGGVDRYAIGRIGGEYVSLRLLALQVLPLWALVVVFRFAVTAVALLGVYLFATRLVGVSPVVGLALGGLYSVSFDFNATLTFLYGFGLPALPLLFYVLFAGRWSPSWILAAAAVGTAIVTTADPIYWLPVSWVCSAAIALWRPPRQPAFTVGVLAVLSVFWLVNYIETLTAFVALLPYSGRLANPVDLSVTDLLAMHARWLLRPELRFNQGGPPFVLPLMAALVAGLWLRERAALVAAVAALVVAFAPPLLVALPWHAAGVAPLASYRWYWEYGALSLAVFAAARAAAAPSPALKAAIVGGAVALALAMQIVLKLENLGQAATRGNLTELAAIPNLRDTPWRTNTEARVVAIPTQMDPNALVGYGFANLDGGATLVHRDVHAFWSGAIMRTEPRPMRELLGFGFHPDFLGCCAPLNADSIADFDLLRLANVGYVVSRRQLNSTVLVQVSGPAQQVRIRGWRRALTPAPPVFIYRLADPLPRVFPATGLTTIPDGVEPGAVIQRLHGDALDKRRAVVLASDANALREVPTAAVRLTYRIRNDGFDIDLPDRSGGVLLVNAPYLPWWRAVSDTGRTVVVRPANLIHMALAVPPGTGAITLRYERPLVWDRVRAALRQGL